MSLIQGRTHVGNDGELRIPLPPALSDRDVDYTLTVHPTTQLPNGGLPTDYSRQTSREEWRRAIQETAGSIPDFPDIERPGPDSYEGRDSF
jgi:hypothetical protein